MTGAESLVVCDKHSDATSLLFFAFNPFSKPLLKARRLRVVIDEKANDSHTHIFTLMYSCVFLCIVMYSCNIFLLHHAFLAPRKKEPMCYTIRSKPCSLSFCVRSAASQRHCSKSQGSPRDGASEGQQYPFSSQNLLSCRSISRSCSSLSVSCSIEYVLLEKFLALYHRPGPARGLFLGQQVTGSVCPIREDLICHNHAKSRLVDLGLGGRTQSLPAFLQRGIGTRFSRKCFRVLVQCKRVLPREHNFVEPGKPK